MKMVRLDVLLAETRKLKHVKPLTKQYTEVGCPFCGTLTLAFNRNFHKGIRCKNPSCRAKLSHCFNEAMRDLAPAKEAAR